MPYRPVPLVPTAWLISLDGQPYECQSCARNYVNAYDELCERTTFVVDSRALYLPHLSIQPPEVHSFGLSLLEQNCLAA
jgi:hypothetical protein